MPSTYTKTAWEGFVLDTIFNSQVFLVRVLKAFSRKSLKTALNSEDK
jgi:hypothetical protein